MCDHEHLWATSSTWVLVKANVPWLPEVVDLPRFVTALELEECDVCHIARIPEKGHKRNTAATNVQMQLADEDSAINDRRRYRRRPRRGEV